MMSNMPYEATITRRSAWVVASCQDLIQHVLALLQLSPTQEKTTRDVTGPCHSCYI